MTDATSLLKEAADTKCEFTFDKSDVPSNNVGSMGNDTIVDKGDPAGPVFIGLLGPDSLGVLVRRKDRAPKSVEFLFLEKDTTEAKKHAFMDGYEPVDAASRSFKQLLALQARVEALKALQVRLETAVKVAEEGSAADKAS